MVKNCNSYSGATAVLQRRYSGAVFYLSLISFVVKTKKKIQKSSLVLVNDLTTLIATAALQRCSSGAVLN